MSHSHSNKGNGIGPFIKALVVALFRLIAIVLGFAFTIIAAIFTFLASITQKLSGHGGSH